MHPAKWTNRLLNAYAKITYWSMAGLGLVSFSISDGRLRQISRKLRCYSLVANAIGALLMARVIIVRLWKLRDTTQFLGIDFMVPLMGCLIMADLMVYGSMGYVITGGQQVRDLVASLLRLQREVKNLRNNNNGTNEQQHLAFSGFHCKFFLCYAAVTSLQLLIAFGQVIQFVIGTTTWIMLPDVIVPQLYYEIVPSGLGFALTMALFLYDALATSLVEELSRRRGSSLYHRRRAVECLYNLNSWSLNFNRFAATLLFLYYGRCFFDALVDFYYVFAQIFAKDNIPLEYVIMLSKMIKPHLTNLIAERSVESFRRACHSLGVGPLSWTEDKKDQHLLSLHGNANKFHCGSLFTINRSMMMSFYAEIFINILTLMQFKMELRD